jgi:hypothetical protein
MWSDQQAADKGQSASACNASKLVIWRSSSQIKIDSSGADRLTSQAPFPVVRSALVSAN